MTKESDSSISFGVGLLAGVVAGVVAGILYSPKSGEEMRQTLKDTAEKLSDKINPEVKEVGLDLIDKVTFKIEKQFERINEVIRANRLAAAKQKEENDAGIY